MSHLEPTSPAPASPHPARRLRRPLLLAAWSLVLIAVFAAGASRSATTPATAVKKSTPPASKAQIERGRYLVTIVGCNDCHTPLEMGPKGPEPDMSRMLSGHPEQMVMPAPPKMAPDAPWNWAGAATLTAFAGPWGISYAANLTPDQNTGLGIWTEDMFVKAMRTGRHMGQSREILPPMPWHWFAQMTDQDLQAIYAYLRTIPPIHNRVPDAVIAPPPPAAAAAPGKR